MSAVAATRAATTARPLATGHLDQVDLFRVVTFAAVVAVHTIATGGADQTPVGGAVEVVLHYTREAFFLLSGFVLAWSQRNRPLRLGRFWRRRFTLVGIPYVVWSLVYTAVDWYSSGRPGAGVMWHLVWFGLLTGRAWYHLYFLLVTLQVYLLWPLLVRLRRPAAAHPFLVVGVAAASGVVATRWAHVLEPGSGFGQWWRDYSPVTVLPYLYWVVAGAVLAWHAERAQAWALRHRRAVVLASLGGLAVALGWYAHQVATGWPPLLAADPVQPSFLLWGSGAIAVQGLLALAWRRRRRPGSRATRLVMWGSSASFGVYLVHPLVLEVLSRTGFHHPGRSVFGEPWVSLVTWALVLAVTSLVVLAIRATPLSVPLTGRARR